MADSHQGWLSDVRAALDSINMGFDNWQAVWAFDFREQFDVGMSGGDAGMRAN